ncbi:hypothetical protein VTO42DRAFT_7095 [Malbranchea cinnamomea]
MAVKSDILEKIQAFSEDCRRREEEQRVSEGPSDLDLEEYNRRVDRTLLRLQEQVEQQETTLQELRRSRPIDLPRPDLDPRERLAQIRRATEAYRSLAKRDPEIPAADSPLGGLLALREYTRLVNGLRESITAAARTLNEDRERLKVEETNLRDGDVIRAGLRARIERLRFEQENHNSRSRSKKIDQEQMAKELMQKLRNKNSEIEGGTEELKTALKQFIDERLAAMLAAEDLGGPVVGDQLDIPDEVLEAGYTAQGKERKPKNSAGNMVDRRQRKIEGYLEGRGDTPRNKREAAGAEMHRLIEDILQAASTSSPYIELNRDSAASRFLVKAKIAQYHPRDSRKLRLIDFASEISD